MFQNNNNQTLEEQLLFQLDKVAQEIVALEAQRVTLQNLLMKARQQSVVREVTRKNSFVKILTEKKIVETLKNSNKPVRISNLYKEAKKINFQLKENTFRSYLSRLKGRGVIVSTNRRGFWTISKE